MFDDRPAIIQWIMRAHEVFCVLAVLLGIGTMAIFVATARVRNGWMAWLAIPIVAFVWYWVLVCLYIGYYLLRVSGVR